jgi:hypothetical protein
MWDVTGSGGFQAADQNAGVAELADAAGLKIQ